MVGVVVGSDDARGIAMGEVTGDGDDMLFGGETMTCSKPCDRFGWFRSSTGGTGIGRVADDDGVVCDRSLLGPASTTVLL